MLSGRRCIFFPLIILSSIALFGCEKTDQLSNLDFEDGTINTWSVIGSAFSISDETTYSSGERYYLQNGLFHIVGSSENTGELISPTFKVGSSGYISFLLSGGSDPNTTYVGVFSAQSHEMLLKITNEYYLYPFQTDTYIRFNIDCQNFKNKNLYLKIVDESSESYINFDHLVTSFNETELLDYLDDTNVRLGIAQDRDMRRAADIYIKLNAWKIDKNQRFSYHLTGQTGWINDPNGFSFFNNKIHLFYQHNPYAVRWGPMHWGHATSDDFIQWTYENIALAPDQEYDAVGAFSGSAIVFDGAYYLVYTGASPAGQVQALAKSTDGVEFVKYENNPIVSGNHLPANTSTIDFRDPKLLVHDDWIYMIVSARNVTTPYSSLLLYKTKDMYQWQYAGRAFSNGAQYVDKLGIMLECPDLIQLNGKDIIIVSPQSVTNHRNSDGNVYIVGQMNWQNGVMENVNYDNIREIDRGFDFYAPTTMKMPDGRTIMVAWMAGWNRTPVTSEFGFAGAQTLPRSITYENDRLIQWPVKEIENYYANSKSFTVTASQTKTIDNRLDGRVKDISLSFSPKQGKTGITLFSDEDGNGVDLFFENGHVTLDRSRLNQGYFPNESKHNIVNVPVNLIDGKVKMRILLDKYSMEIFLADGQETITATTMSSPSNNHVLIYGEDKTFIQFESHDIVI